MAVSEALIKRLNSLLMLDHDAVDAYQQAIDRMSSEYCRTQLLRFQADHRQHIVDLKACITNYDARAEDHHDAKGFFIKGMTALQSMMGDEMALKAMQTNEKLTNQHYQDALDEQSLPDDVRRLVLKNRADEARHLDWINKALDQKLWEPVTETPVEP